MANLGILSEWREQLLKLGGDDTLLSFQEKNAIDLTHAHPSGLAQLLTGRDTYLSNLIRDARVFGEVFKSAQAVITKALELNNERGISVGYLAVGIASWTAGTFLGEKKGVSKSIIKAPILLIPIAMTMREGKNDFSLRLESGAKINPALIRIFSKHYNIYLDSDFLTALAYVEDRFDPAPMLDNLRNRFTEIAGISVSNQLFVSTFADIVEPFMSEKFDLAHPIISGLLNTGDSDDNMLHIEELSNSYNEDINPELEFSVLDADEKQQEILDLIQKDANLVINTIPGSGATQLAVNIIANLAARGKNVLVVSERRARLYEIYKQFHNLNLETLPIFIDNKEALVPQITKAIVRNEKFVEKDFSGIQETLVRSRRKLIEQNELLHKKSTRWGVSPYEAMQSLAKLMSLKVAPQTSIRLSSEVLSNMGDLDKITQKLQQSADLGSFAFNVENSPWYGAKLFSVDDSQRAYSIVQELDGGEFEDLYKKIVTVTKHSEISLSSDLRSWGAQLSLLLAVRDSLDKFTPDIFERSAHELIIATSSARWRKDTGNTMGSMMRSRLRKLAKEFIRPGAHIGDLHGALCKVDEQREAWKCYAKTSKNPSVPGGLAELDSLYRKVVAKLHILGKFLETTCDGGALLDMRYDELSARLSSLVQDRNNLEFLPKRNLVTKSLKDQGLGELLDDLARRGVTRDNIGEELALTWWQSVLEIMLFQEGPSSMLSGEQLRKLEAEYRFADQAHVESAAHRLAGKLADNWHRSVSSYPGQAALLRKSLKEGIVDFTSLLIKSRDLLKGLAPVSFISPYNIPSIVPFGQYFDAVIILDSESMATSLAASAISRAKQTIAFGDSNLGVVTNFSVSIDSSVENGKISDKPSTSILSSLKNILPQKKLDVVYRSAPSALLRFLKANYYPDMSEIFPPAKELVSASSGLLVEEIAGGTGMPFSDTESVESVEAEVARVVDLVFEHARVSPLQSLAVITFSKRHAARVAEAININLPNYPLYSGFFERKDEPFLVLDVERSYGVSRDAIIFSLGYGRTPHGRVIYNFGSLSLPGGSERFVLALTRARNSLHVLTCFSAKDLVPERLSYGARDLYNFLMFIDSSRYSNFLDTAAVFSGDDALTRDLVARIKSFGLLAYVNYANSIDVAVTAFEGSNSGLDSLVPIAIDTDGGEAFRGRSVRSRIRLRPQLLERFGWRYVPIRVLEIFSDPEGCVNIIRAYAGYNFKAEARSIVLDDKSDLFGKYREYGGHDYSFVSENSSTREII